MTNLQKKLATVISAGAILFNTTLPVFAETTIVISGNGAGSDNYATVNQTSTTTVTQSNNANVTNNVDADADTGDNDAKFNTGGDVTIYTGSASVKALVSNDLNRNAAEVNCCEPGSTDVLIEGNGAFSDNTVNLTGLSTTSLNQGNNASVQNNINVDADSGDNDANSNAGGDVTVKTGKADVTVGVSTKANANWAKISPALGQGSSNVSLRILDNGAGSDNWIKADLIKSVSLNQSNTANVNNSVDADSDTGDNDAKFNTGGDVTIYTGDAKVTAAIDNMVNFNYADVDCGCAWGLLAKIAGNGAEVGYDHYKNSGGDDNTILATLVSTRNVGQGNNMYLNNDYDGWKTETGDNEAKMNTGGVEGADPSILTGDADVLVGIANNGNVNRLGTNFPTFPFPFGDWEWEFSWEWFFIGL